MPGEEERLGIAATLLTSSVVVTPGTDQRTNHEGVILSPLCEPSGSAHGLPKSHPRLIVAQIPSHHAEIEETETPTSSVGGGSKCELELEFAGVDTETAELEEVECNYGSGVFGSSSPVLEVEGEEEEGTETKPPNAPIPLIPQTLVQKCLFYMTAFFILLAVFSLFSFLFLVPFVIDPAFTTIFNEFDPEPAHCVTEEVVNLNGTQCTRSWTSCREGCTKEVYNCTQIWVSYRSGASVAENSLPSLTPTHISLKHKHVGAGTSPHYYNYNHNSVGTTGNEASYTHKKKKHKGGEMIRGGVLASPSPPPTDGWFRKAHLFPNVKGCGYPPAVNCSIFLSKYAQQGRNFSCFYSKVKPWLVVTKFNMNHVILELALSMAIPIPCFLISIIYLVFAYFKIYNTSSTANSQNVPPLTTTNNNIVSPSPEPAQTSLSTLDEKAKAVRRSSSRTLNALTEKLLPNSKTHPPMEMNDLTPIIRRNSTEETQIRNNRAPERNGPTKPPAKNKGILVVDVSVGSEETSLSQLVGERFLEPIETELPTRISSFPTNEILERNPQARAEQSEAGATLNPYPEEARGSRR